MAQWIGQSVSIECGNGVIYQGIVSSVNSDSSSVSLVNPFKNGKPCGVSVSIASSDIRNLQFVAPTRSTGKPVVESSDDDSSRVMTHTKRPSHKKSSGSRLSATPEVKQPEKATIIPISKPRRRSNSLDNNKSELSDSIYPPMTPTTRAPPRYHRNYQSDCFSVSVESCQGDFDFESNLALFDKQQVFGEIENGKVTPNKHSKYTQSNYKHDEMVVKHRAKPKQQIKLLGPSHATGFYSTDDGLLIPCTDLLAREKLFQHAASYGFTEQRRVDIVGRNTCDMVFQLIGGSSRLNQQNTHQQPTVIVLAGPHVQGCYGVSCARHLANHNVNTVVFSRYVTTSSDRQLLDSELSLYNMCGNRTISDAQELPASTVDLIINCLDGGGGQANRDRTSAWYRYIANWCNTSRARVLAIDPPAEGCAIETKYSVHIGLPQMLDRDTCGQTYLCDIGLPRDLYKFINISYRSPFSVKFCIPLCDQ